MFGIFAPETVQFIDMKDAVITFLTARKKTPGQTIKVRFVLPNAPKPHRLDITVKVTAVRMEGQTHVCVALVLAPESALPQIEDLLRSFGMRADLGFAGRRSARLPISLRVMSRELPGYGAVTVDISEHGVKLNCHGVVKQGLHAYLVIESDVASVENLSLRARAIWCRENPSGKGYLVGCEFYDVNAAQQDALYRYCKSLAARLRGDVMHRQIADGEMTVRPDDNVSSKSSGTLPAVPAGYPPPPAATAYPSPPPATAHPPPPPQPQYPPPAAPQTHYPPAAPPGYPGTPPGYPGAPPGYPGAPPGYPAPPSGYPGAPSGSPAYPPGPAPGSLPPVPPPAPGSLGPLPPPPPSNPGGGFPGFPPAPTPPPPPPPPGW